MEEKPNVISSLINRPFIGRKSTWVTGSFRWLNRFLSEHKTLTTKSELMGKINTLIYERNDRKDRSKCSLLRKHRRIKKSINYDKFIVQNRKYITGFSVILRIRLNLFNRISFLVRIGKLSPFYKYRCPLCKGVTDNQEFHLFVECEKVKNERQTYLDEIIGSETFNNLRRSGEDDHRESMLGLFIGSALLNKEENIRNLLKSAQFLTEIIPRFNMAIRELVDDQTN